MPFATFRGGDRFGARAAANVPKTYQLANYNWASSYPGFTGPKPGDLAKPFPTNTVVTGNGAGSGAAGVSPILNNEIVLCAATDVPVYLVESVNSNNGTLSCWIIERTLQLVFPYTNTLPPVAGLHQILPDPAGTPNVLPPVQTPPLRSILWGGNDRARVQAVPSPGGAGLIVAVNEPLPGFVAVEFRGGAL
jgi:hypothetical protein